MRKANASPGTRQIDRLLVAGVVQLFEPEGDSDGAIELVAVSLPRQQLNRGPALSVAHAIKKHV